jgi:hypothetical protein
MQGWDGPESRTATSTATAFVSGVPAVFARARMMALNWADGIQPNTYEGRNRHWGQVVAGFKSCQPDRRISSSEAVSEKSGTAFSALRGGRAPAGTPSEQQAAE